MNYQLNLMHMIQKCTARGTGLNGLQVSGTYGTGNPTVVAEEKMVVWRRNSPLNLNAMNDTKGGNAKVMSLMVWHRLTMVDVSSSMFHLCVKARSKSDVQQIKN